MTAQKNAPLPFKARYRRFSYALMSALAAMALTACGGGGKADDAALASAQTSADAAVMNRLATLFPSN